MGMMIGLSLTQISAAGAEALPGSTYSATLADFPVPLAIFDSGAARGANAADITISGTTDAPNGIQIEARVVRSDTGAQIHGWTPVATASGGLWSGVFPVVPRNSHRLKLEVRPAGSSASAGTMTTEFMVGHIIVLIGQSEDARMFGTSFDNRTYQSIPTFADDAARDSFFLMSDVENTYGGNGILQINEATPFTASTAHLANVITRNAPGEKFLFIEAAVSGTPRADLADSPDDSSNGRAWGASFYDALTIVRAYGADAGVVMDSWTAADGGGTAFREKTFPFHSGLQEDGSTYTLGDVSTAAGAVRWPNILFDLSGVNGGIGPHVAFDETVTKHAFHGPHRFEDFLGGSLRDAKEGTRTAIRSMVADPLLSQIMRPKGPEILLYQNGTPSDDAGSKSYNPDRQTWIAWADSSHPSDYTDDGLTARARHTAIAALYALGVGPAVAQSHYVPVFNRAYWEPAGAYVEVWYEDPDGNTPAISTTRLERGDAAIPDTYAHRTEVAGFYINTTPAERAEIVAGRVRIYPESLGAFDYSHTIRYGIGGASGVVQYPEDEYDDIWKNLPLVVAADLGLTGIEGIALEPLPTADDIANTLTAPDSFTTSASGPYFMNGPVNYNGSPTLTIAFKGQFSDDSTGQIAAISGKRLTLERTDVDLTRLTLKDNTNTALTPSSPQALSAHFVAGVSYDIVFSMDLTANVARLWVDGTLTDDITLSPNSGAMDSNRDISLLAASSGANQVVGTVEYIRYWTGYTSDGDTGGLGTPVKSISGNAATVNGDPWKLGSDAS